MKILYKYASRSRPEFFFRGLNTIIENSTDPNFAVLCAFDLDDPTMNNQQVQQQLMNSPINDGRLMVAWGKSDSKIHAINRDMHLYPNWDIVCCMSDDMAFTLKGFDNIIRMAFTQNFPDLDGVIHFTDGNQHGNCMTMSIIGSKYFNRDNHIYYPEYKSLWCDMDAMECAKKRGKYVYMGDEVRILRHLHPAYGLANRDAQYDKTESPEMWDHDQKIYNQRINKNFEL